MPAEIVKYRIRGLIEPEVNPPAPVPEKKTFREVPLSEFPSRPSLDAALMAVGRATLIDFIPQAPIDRLKTWWPTFGFFARQGSPKPIKIQPTALGPYLPDSRIESSTPEFEIIEKYYQEQAREKDNIDRVLALAEDRKSKSRPCSVDSPVALALLCTLFRGSIPGKHDKTRLLEMIGGSPLAAYIMLHVGSRPDQRANFIRQIMADPHLALDLCVEGLFEDVIPEESVPKAFDQAPHLFPLASYAQKKLNDHDAWQALVDLTHSHPLAAAFALGLDPDNGLAKEWHYKVAQNPEAIYWALRVWGRHRSKATDFPYWQEFQTRIKKDLRWLYHWVRDIDQTEAREAVRWHWPNPWAVEMIVDLKLEPEFVRELCQTSFSNSDPDDPWTSALVLWAAAYIEAKEKNENETSENN